MALLRKAPFDIADEALPWEDEENVLPRFAEDQGTAFRARPEEDSGEALGAFADDDLDASAAFHEDGEDAFAVFPGLEVEPSAKRDPDAVRRRRTVARVACVLTLAVALEAVLVIVAHLGGGGSKPDPPASVRPVVKTARAGSAAAPLIAGAPQAGRAGTHSDSARHRGAGGHAMPATGPRIHARVKQSGRAHGRDAHSASSRRHVGHARHRRGRKAHHAAPTRRTPHQNRPSAPPPPPATAPAPPPARPAPAPAPDPDEFGFEQ